MSAAESLRHPALWRGFERAPARLPGVPTGFAALDALLPGGGWPRGALAELIPERAGIGEFSLLLPALAQLTGTGRWAALVAPPHIPYAPALAVAGIALERLLVVRCAASAAPWAVEQMLRSRAFDLVAAWPASPGDRALRRLQLAAEEGECAAVLYAPPAAAAQASPAALRLRLAPTPGGLAVHVLKRRGGAVDEAVVVDTLPSSAVMQARHALDLPAPACAAAGSHPPRPA